MSKPPDAEMRARLEAFSLKLHALIQAEQESSGLSGCLMGYSIGLMRAHGATEEDVRGIFERVITPVFTFPITNSNIFPTGDPS